MSIWEKKLRDVRVLVTHANCNDGLASAMLVKDALPNVEVRFVSHNSPEHLGMHAEPGMLFVDFAPPAVNAREFLEAGTLVLDHHKYSRDVVLPFVELKQGVFAREESEPGVSGAVLAYAYVWERLEHAAKRSSDVGGFAQLVGIRDTWQTRHENWGQAQQLHATLAAFPRELWLLPGGVELALDYAQAFGARLVENKAERVMQLVQGGLVRRNAGGLVWALSMAPFEFVSDLGEAARNVGVNVLVNVTPFVELGRLYYTISLRSDESVDVGKVAHAFGGGGHARAAGFRSSQASSIIETFGLLVDDMVAAFR